MFSRLSIFQHISPTFSDSGSTGSSVTPGASEQAAEVQAAGSTADEEEAEASANENREQSSPAVIEVSATVEPTPETETTAVENGSVNSDVATSGSAEDEEHRAVDGSGDAPSAEKGSAEEVKEESRTEAEGGTTLPETAMNGEQMTEENDVEETEAVQETEPPAGNVLCVPKT